MHLILLFALFGAVAVAMHLGSTTAKERRASQREFDVSVRWLWIPTAILIAFMAFAR